VAADLLRLGFFVNVRDQALLGRIAGRQLLLDPNGKLEKLPL